MEEVKETWNHENTINNQAAAKGKWEEAEELAKQMKLKECKEAVAKFRLMSGHDCLPHHLYRLGMYPSSSCPLCADPDQEMDQQHLLHCPQLNNEAQNKLDFVSLYWEARGKMTLLSTPAI